MTGKPIQISQEEAFISLNQEINGVNVQVGKAKLKDIQKLIPQGFFDGQMDLDSTFNSEFE